MRLSAWLTRWFSVGCVGLMGSSAWAADFYVSPAGDDANDGSRDQPVVTLAKARDLTRPMAGKEAVTVHVADGVYYLPETLVFSPADSGSADHPVMYRAQNEGGAVLSGGSKLDLTWTPAPDLDGVFQATTPVGIEIDQLFVNGKNQRMARYPDYDPNKPTAAYQGFAADAISKERAALWEDPTGGYIHAMHLARWGGFHYQITGKDDEGELTYEGGWQNNRSSEMHKDFRMVENIFEELDAPGEWYHNAKTNTLYHIPSDGNDLSDAKIEVVRLRHLVEFNGSEAEPVKHITMQGFVVRHAARTFMDTKEPLLRSDWMIYRGGAFVLKGTEHLSVIDCEFDQVGGNAVFVSNYNRHVLIKGCHIHNTGASGVCFVGDPDAVRDPLFRYGQKNDLWKIDRTPGPKTNNYPADSAVEDCLIHGIGRVERQPAGVQVSMSARIAIRDTSIYDTARAGINFSEGTWGGHLIERCDVFDTVLETHDHGSFNSWGRDRYWRSDHKKSPQQAVNEDPSLPFLDAMETTVIRDSRWRCEHGWDIDLDDGSSNYDIYNNLMLAGGLKLREGFRRHAWNNVIVNNGLSSHLWFANCNDQVTRNIMAKANGALLRVPTDVSGLVDQNFYYQADQSTLDTNVEKYGWDANSSFGDPMFVDPENGDFRVQDGSPALSIGFENFPMDQFGVKKPALKAIAKTPSFGPKSRRPGKNSGSIATSLEHVWLGMPLHSLRGNDFSAYGVSKSDGGVALKSVPQASAATKAGLKQGDLIQGVNGKPTATTKQLFEVLAEAQGGALSLKVVRDQQVLKLDIEPNAEVVIETAESANGFKRLEVPAASGKTVTTQVKTSNDPPSTLTDGKLGGGYGPVFRNGTSNGAYKIDLGKPQPISAITSWSHKESSQRGDQLLTLYASAGVIDPGWDLSRYTPLGTIRTGQTKTKFVAASLRAVDGQTLGSYRWILWRVSPVHSQGGGENTAFQELAVEVGP